jgi:hypothetical protein
MTSAIVGFDISRNYTLEAGYIGRFGRDLLVRRDPGDAAQPGRSGVEHGLLHRGPGDDPRGAGRRPHRQFARVRLCGAARHRLLAEHLPGRRRRRLDGDAGHHAGLHAKRSRLDHGALRHGHLVLAGVQQVRSVRLLRRAVRLAGRDQLDRPLELQRG